MDVSQVTSASLSNSQVQGVQGHHHHHRKSMADKVDDMQSAIDDAVKSGKLTSDQASALTKELDEIKKMLSQVQTSPGAGGATRLSSGDQDKMRKELQDVGKKLFSALNASSSSQQSNGVDAFFKALDSNKDGSISKGEMSSFFNSLTSGGSTSGGSNPSTMPVGNYAYSSQASLTVIRMQSTFSMTA
jgi:hypothetical protein